MQFSLVPTLNLAGRSYGLTTVWVTKPWDLSKHWRAVAVQLRRADGSSS